MLHTDSVHGLDILAAMQQHEAPLSAVTCSAVVEAVEHAGGGDEGKSSDGPGHGSIGVLSRFAEAAVAHYKQSKGDLQVGVHPTTYTFW